MITSIYSRCGLSILLLTALLTASVGCGVKTHPVTGTLTYEGQPFSGGGDIQFIPADGESKPAAGVIDEDGTYILSTFGIDDGAVAGEYRVEVIQNEVLQPAKYLDTEEPGEGGEEKIIDPELEQKEVLIADEDRIPDLYSGPKSTLTATVVAGENTINFDLKRGDFDPNANEDDDDE